jgi:hypothetical protein
MNNQNTIADTGGIIALTAAPLINAAPGIGAPLLVASIGNASVFITFFEDYAATSYTTDNLCLADLCERVRNASRHKRRTICHG